MSVNEWALPAKKSWRTASLNELGQLYCGQSPASSTVNTNGIGTLYVSGPEQWDGHKIRQDKWTNDPKRFVPDGCIFITVKGAGVGKIFPGISCSIGRDIYAFKPKAELSAKFIEHAIRFTVQDVLRHAVGDIPGLSKAHILQHEIGIPELQEQERIVAEIEKQFSRLDEAVANLKRVKANLKRYKAAVLKAAVEGRLIKTEAEIARREARSYETGEQLLQRILETRRSQWKGKGKYREPAAPDTTDLPELPEGWVWASLDQVTSKITSGSRDWSPYYGIGTSIFVLAQNVRPLLPDFSVQQVVDPPADDPSCERSRIKDGDLLATIVGANTGQVCLVSQMPGIAYVCQSVALMRPVSVEMSLYLNCWLNSADHGQRYFKRCMYGQGRPHLSFEQLMATPIAVPSIIKQHCIVADVERRFSFIREIENQVGVNLFRVKRLRQSILAAAFLGRLIGGGHNNLKLAVIEEIEHV